MPIREIPLESPIEEKIAWAENCFSELSEEFLGDGGIRDLLAKYKRAIDESHLTMAESGLVVECRDCEEREGGSCCGAGLENRYSGTLLLINLLLSVKIPEKSPGPSSCFFLGPEGCQLMARHVICVNYLCKKVTDHIAPKKIASLREKEGVELETLFHLQERIKKILALYQKG